ncbi:MAG: AAA family ATPase [Acetobacteraceae bacterium]|nr:AAA family ATPase [Acetobacteraceae bacterium]
MARRPSSSPASPRHRGPSAPPGGPELEMVGVVRKVRYHHPDTHYTVADFIPSPAAGSRLDQGDMFSRPRPAALSCSGASPRSITIQGYFPQSPEGQEMRIFGHWVTHPRYGPQFEVARYERVKPSTPRGIAAYLQSGLVRGVGPRTAEKIVAHFGADTLRIIQEDPARLSEVRGLSPKKAEAIARALAAHRDLEEVMVFLYDHGVTPHLASRIYKRYGAQTIAVLQENPYRLTEDLWGVGFLTADRIALAGGLSPRSPFRVQAGLRHALSEAAASAGHTFLPQGELSCTALVLLSRAEEGEGTETGPRPNSGTARSATGDGEGGARGPSAGAGGGEAEGSARSAAAPAASGRVTADDIKEALAALAQDGRAIVEEGRVYLPHLHRAEVQFARALRRLAERDKPPPLARRPGLVADAIDQAQAEAGLDYAPEQRRAVEQAASSWITVITGGPGTGKTTVVKGIIGAFLALNPRCRVLLCAPTGRAAKRLSEATGREAATIHRLLGYRPGPMGWYFERDEHSPLEGDLLIVDEFSMVDVLLAWDLFRAVPEEMQVVLVGDADQLPSVGPGHVLRDVVVSGRVPTVRLLRIFRQGEGSAIVANAHRVRSGLMPEAPPTAGSGDPEFAFLQLSGPDAVARVLVDRCRALAQAGLGLDQFQVLSPMYRGPAGVDALNAALQEALNPAAPGRPELRAGAHAFRLGDKVMQLRNNYEKEVYNGDIGVVAAVDAGRSGRGAQRPGGWGADDGEDEDAEPYGGEGASGRGGEGGGSTGGAGAPCLVVDFYGRRVGYYRDELDEVTLAYAVTVHKAQGSEFPWVLMPLVSQHYIMLRRNLLYTAISRARRHLILAGERRALAIAVKNDQVERRHTYLRQRLEAEGAGGGGEADRG